MFNRQSVAVAGICVAMAVVVAGCSNNANSPPFDAPVPDAPAPDGPGADAPINCVPGSTQCNNCIDDDGDGAIDGFDVSCTGPLDNDESSFATGINGDNVDGVQQDCFFDGNSGGGDDGCNIHVCCLLDECPEDIGGPQFDPESCQSAITQDCVDSCFPLTPPGCDCFGCCTICDEAGCETVLTNPTVAPDCTEDTIHDPSKCLACTPTTACGQPCGGETCVLCPGQDAGDLPPGCENAGCPANSQTCTTSAECGAGAYCATGCCISGIS